MRILAINPWIYDFAAYDFWLKPYGFLVLLTYLKNKGIHIDYIDCLNKKKTHDNFGRGKYYSEIIPKPRALKTVPRYFKRYGLTIPEFKNLLSNSHPKIILITSSMTYWYPAVKDLVEIIKKEFLLIPKILGGIYPTLLPAHAQRNISCEYIFPNYNLDRFFKFINLEFDPQVFYSTLPDYENFYSHLDYVVLRTSWGCPFSCSYCAIKKLFPHFLRIPINKVIDFIYKYFNKGVKNFVFYDDALLYPPREAKKLLKNLAGLKINANFHTPNALHLRFLDEEIAYFLKKSGFVNPHFGLETLNPQLQKLWGDKVNRENIIKGIKSLKKGGFKDGEFSVYLLLGYPDQDLEELKKDIEYLHSQGAKISLAEFSPVPGTEIFHKYKDKLSEPLYHNNSIFSFFSSTRLKEIYLVKNYVRELNRQWKSL